MIYKADRLARHMFRTDVRRLAEATFVPKARSLDLAAFVAARQGVSCRTAKLRAPLVCTKFACKSWIV